MYDSNLAITLKKKTLYKNRVFISSIVKSQLATAQYSKNTLLHSNSLLFW